MTIISYSRKFIFIRSRKTAGLSIQNFLEEFCENDDLVSRSDSERFSSKKYKAYLCEKCNGVLKQHTPIMNLKNRGIKVNQFYSFGFVRNPWDLMVSRYFWNKHTDEHIYRDPDIDLDFNDWLKKRFDRKITSGMPGMLDFRKDLQFRYFCDENGVLAVNKIGRFENLKKDLFDICNDLELDTVNKNLKRLHKSIGKNEHYSKYYSNKSIKLVDEKFNKDIQLFEYDFEDKR